MPMRTVILCTALSGASAYQVGLVSPASTAAMQRVQTATMMARGPATKAKEEKKKGFTLPSFGTFDGVVASTSTNEQNTIKAALFGGAKATPPLEVPGALLSKGKANVPAPVGLALVGAPLITALLAIFIVNTGAPGMNKTPFAFVDGFYPPRVEYMKQEKARKDATEAKAKAEAAAKKKVEEEAAAKAAAEAKAAEAKAAAAAPKAAAPKAAAPKAAAPAAPKPAVAPKPAAAPKPAPAPQPAAKAKVAPAKISAGTRKFEVAAPRVKVARGQ